MIAIQGQFEVIAIEAFTLIFNCVIEALILILIIIT